jgi:hypothetical protein
VAGEVGGNDVPHDNLRLRGRRPRRDEQGAADLAQAFSWNFRHRFFSLKEASDSGSFVIRTALPHPRLSLMAGKKLVQLSKNSTDLQNSLYINGISLIWSSRRQRNLSP